MGNINIIFFLISHTVVAALSILFFADIPIDSILNFAGIYITSLCVIFSVFVIILSVETFKIHSYVKRMAERIQKIEEELDRGREINGNKKNGE